MTGFDAYCRLRQCLAGSLRILAGTLRCRRVDRLADRLAFMPSVYGPRLLVTPGDRTFELCLGGYGPFVAGAIGAQDRPFVFLDVGANLGLFSLVALLNPHCRRAIAIEPLPAIFSNLEANIRYSGTTRITALRGAIFEGSASRVAMSYDPTHSGMSQALDSGTAGIEVPVISTQILNGALAGEAERIVAKIDIEGSESDAIAVLRKTEAYSRLDEIIVEVSERTLGAGGRARLLQMLADDGFEEIARSGEPGHYDARYRRHHGSTRQAAQETSRPG